MKLRSLIAATGAACLVLGACSSDDHHDDGHEEHEGEATGSTCPTDNPPTYEDFAKGFAESYCTRCHSSEKTGDERQGAPLDHDFDTEAGFLKHADHVDERAAAGPDAVNTLMPPSNPKPTEAERRKLGEWLACNAK